MYRLLISVLTLLFPLVALAGIVSSIDHPISGERFTFTDEVADCPQTETIKAHRVLYLDPRDGETAVGCYVIEGETHYLFFKTGSYANQPIGVPNKLIKPAI